jgi:DHA2 family multidrug resistance protein
VGLNTLTLGFDEVFRLMSYLFVAALVMAPFCKPVNLGAAKPPPDVH